MKKIYSLVAALTIFVSLHAQWNYVGSSVGFSNAGVTDVSIALDNSGTPYVCDQDANGFGKFEVRKFNGSNWVLVGTQQWSQSESQAFTPYMTLSSTGTPYVFCTDMNYGTVKKFDGANWVFVGDSQFTLVRPDYLKIAIAGNGTPFVIFSDYYGDYMATVMKFNGTRWDTVGNRYISSSQAYYDCIAFAPTDNNPYVAFSDNDRQNKGTVMKFNGTTWDTLGGRGFTSTEADYISLTVDLNGTPYFAFINTSNGQASVMKYTSGSWNYVGNANFTRQGVQTLSIKTDNAGTPYLCFVDSTGGSSMMKFANNTWSYVGSSSFSNDYVDIGETMMALAANGTPYAVFVPENTHKATVMKFTGANGVEEVGAETNLAVYPNPAGNYLHILTANEKPEWLRIYNLNGQLISEQHFAPQMDISTLTSGIYVLELKGAATAERKMFVKE